jgi:peptidyl-prolyl cis-trans isomerase B (cyclophilin B)
LRRSLTAFAAVAALAVAGCGSGDGESSTSSSNTSTSATTPASTTQASTTPGGCRKVAPPRPRKPGKHPKPSEALAPGKWSLEVRTNCGSFTIALDPKQSPHAAASLVALARDHYFDKTLFHRIVPGFVIQGGDPTATGTGGPGYTTVDRPPGNARYTLGVVAMAKAGNEPRGAAGSQFYVVTGQDAGLPPDYAIVGRISKGLGVVERIGRLGDANEQPTEPVVISAARASKK